MSAEPPMVHVRSLRIATYDEGARICVRAELTDERPWAAGTHQGVLHAMALEATVDVETREILSATADMGRFPHAECPLVTASFERLAGIVVGKGFRRELLKRFGGTQGCTHLVELCRALAPAVVQALQSRQAFHGYAGTAAEGRSIGWAMGMCHVLAPGGPAEQKMRAGWRPGLEEYPVPPVETFPLADDPTASAGGPAHEPPTP